MAGTIWMKMAMGQQILTSGTPTSISGNCGQALFFAGSTGQDQPYIWFGPTTGRITVRTITQRFQKALAA